MNKQRPDNNDYVVYLHRNPTTKDIFYVGIGTIKRAYHFWSRSARWKSYVNKYGKPEVEIYKNSLMQYEAAYLEVFLIGHLGRKGIDVNGRLVNLSIGGDIGSKGMVISEESKRKMSIAKKGKKISEQHKINIGNANTKEKNNWWGKTPSEETRLKMSLAKKGKPSAHAKKVINIKTGEIFPSGAYVARLINKDQTYFCACLSGRLKSISDYRYL